MAVFPLFVGLSLVKHYLYSNVLPPQAARAKLASFPLGSISP
jgi:hypothetical protein